VRAHCAPYLRHGKPIHRTERLNDSVFSIISQFQQEYRGVAEYYRLAYNLHRLTDLRWVMERSLTKTLAAKLGTSVNQVLDRYRTVVPTEQGPKTVLQVVVERAGCKKPLVTQWGGISLARRMKQSSTTSPRASGTRPRSSNSGYWPTSASSAGPG